MKSIRALILASPLFALACTNTSAGPDAPTMDLAPGESAVRVEIVGAGTVSFHELMTSPCSSDGSVPVSCSPIRFAGGLGTVSAEPAKGWAFAGWSLRLTGATITDPFNPSQQIVPGADETLTATFVPLGPIKAWFVQQTYSTSYRVEIENLDRERVGVAWSGPNCGDWTPHDEQSSSDWSHTFEMTWKHPHPPCDESRDHKSAVIKATITMKGQQFVCEYEGAESGDGKTCKRVK